MIDVYIGVILNLLALTAIGIGPALSLLSADERIEIALAVAPTIGFALTSIGGTYLVILDKPVSKWAMPWLVISVTVSLVICLVVARRNKLELSQIDWRAMKLFLAGLALVITLVMTPVIAGGLNFTVLRGNGTDTFNYVAVAGYLDHEPYSWARQTDTQSLIDRHSSYLLALQLLSARWTTSAMLAWTSRIARTPIYRFEHAYSVLSFILAFGPGFWFLLSMKVKPWRAGLLAVAICVGFWAQFVLDTRAMSQINSVPLILLLALLITRIENNPARLALGERTLLSIVLTSLILLYVEIIPLAALGLTIFWGTRLVRGRFSVLQAGGIFLSLVMAVIGVLPAASLLVPFFTSQFRYAAASQNNWHLVFYNWLYSSPLTGVWGLSCISVGGQVGRFTSPGLLKTSLLLLGEALPFVLSALSLLLSLILVFFLVNAFSKRECPAAILLAASFILAALTQFFFLIARGQLWAAGKGLSFGYPFIMVGTVAFIFGVYQSPGVGWLGSLAKVARYGVGLWIAIQCLLGGYRIGSAATGVDYSNYLGNHGEYRRHDWDMSSFSCALQKNKEAAVWLAVSNNWAAEYLSSALGWDVNLINLDCVRDRSGALIACQTSFRFPQYLIIESNLCDVNDITQYTVARNSEFLLIKATKGLWDQPLLLGLHNPNGLERDIQGNTSFWIGGDATQLRLYSPSSGQAILKAKYSAGPSLPERPDRKIVIRLSTSDQAREIIVTESTQEIRIPIRRGLNEIALQEADQPSMSVLPNGDVRPLLLGVSGLRVTVAEVAQEIQAHVRATRRLRSSLSPVAQSYSR